MNLQRQIYLNIRKQRFGATERSKYCEVRFERQRLVPVCLSVSFERFESLKHQVDHSPFLLVVHGL